MLKNPFVYIEILPMVYNYGNKMYIYQHKNIKTKEDVQKVITESQVDAILKELSLKKESEEEHKLLHYFFITKEINGYNQIRLKGLSFDFDWFDNITEYDILNKYLLKCIQKANKYNNCIKKNHKSYVTNWKELYETVGITNKTTQQIFKKVIENNDFIKKIKTLDGDNRIIINPFIVRKSAYIDVFTISFFIDYLKDNKDNNYFTDKMYRYLLFNYENNNLDLTESKYYYSFFGGKDE